MGEEGFFVLGYKTKDKQAEHSRQDSDERKDDWIIIRTTTPSEETTLT